MILRDRATFELAVRLQQQGAPLGEIYAFISGLYFRGKLAYAEAFAAPPEGLTGSFVITPGRGLLPPELPITMEELRHIATVPVEADEQIGRASCRERVQIWVRAVALKTK